MLNVQRTRSWMIVSCLACAAMVVASSAVAKDDQNSGQTQDQKQATASQNAGQSEKETSQSSQTSQSQLQDQQSSQQQTTQQQGAQQDQSQNSQQSGKTAENKHANGKQGGHLGVNITTDKTENGVLVVQILPNTAAQKMGLQRHDRITSLNGEKVQSADEFISEISSMNPGDKVELKVVRNGKERAIRGELEGYSESVVATQGPNGTQEYRQFQSYIDPNQQNGEQAGRDQNLDQQHAGTQASYENRGDSNQSPNGNLESRVSRLEKQIEHISQQLDELVTNNNQGQSASAQKTSSSNTNTR